MIDKLTTDYTVTQRNDYYAWGLPTSTSVNPEAQPYKREGKELYEMHGLNTYDQGARQFGTHLPVTMVPDPMAEKYYSISPYAQHANNPIRYIDPNGMDWYSYQEEYEDENGEIQTRTAYKYVRGTMSQEEMENGGYTHLGQTYYSGNTYYSLGGAEITYDITNPFSLTTLQDIVVADAAIIATANAINAVGTFWDKYKDLISSGTDIAKIISSFIDKSSGFKGILGNIGLIPTAVNIYNDYQLYKDGDLRGEALVDAAINIISLAGPPGAAISVSYHLVAKPAANWIQRFEEYLQRGFRNMLTHPLDYTGRPF